MENITPDKYVDENGTSINNMDEYVCPKIASITIRGPLFFGAADRFESTLSKSIHKRPSVLILKMRHVSMIDVTGVSNVSTLVKNFIKHNGTVMVTELNETSFHTPRMQLTMR